MHVHYENLIQIWENKQMGIGVSIGILVTLIGIVASVFAIKVYIINEENKDKTLSRKYTKGV